MGPKVRIWRVFSETGGGGVCHVSLAYIACVRELADVTDVTHTSAAACQIVSCLSPFYHLPPARCLEWF